jgi:preprotein translocase subunit SecG
MTNDANLSPDPERETSLFQVVTIIFVALFFAVVLMLGISMVHHRFFQGQRVHRNGSVGQ